MKLFKTLLVPVARAVEYAKEYKSKGVLDDYFDANGFSEEERHYLRDRVLE